MPKPKPDNRLKPIAQAKLEDHVIGLAWSPSGDRMAAAVATGAVTIFDAALQAKFTLAGHGFGTCALAWQPRGTLLATAGQDGKARLWDTTTGAEKLVVEGGAAWVERLAWHASGERFATAAGKKVRLWNLAGEMLREYAAHPATVTDLAWQPGADRIAVATYGGVVLYDPALPEAVKTLTWKGSPLALSWSPNGKILTHGNQDATVHFWYVAQDHPLQMSGFPRKVRELSWDFSSRYLATGGGPAICLWDTAGAGPEGKKPQMLFDETTEAPITAIAWQKKNPLLASANAAGKIYLWQPAAKVNLIGTAKLENEATTLTWHPDDRTLATGGALGEVMLYRVG
jgi:WD40 repeat protein